MKTSLSLDHLTDKDIKGLLDKMSVPCEINKDDTNVLHVDVPVTRSDIMHECDLVEDLAIAYGYNNLHTEVPSTFAGAKLQPVNHLSDMMRAELAMAGFTECLNWALISRKENFTCMRQEEKVSQKPYEYAAAAPAVSISDAKTKE